jgi:threonine synthase
MGLPIAQLIVGSNRNDILTRFLAANDMTVRSVEPSLSPSMDIQVSSNFERLLFELLHRDAGATAETMRRFRTEGRMPIPDTAWSEATQIFRGFALDDAGTLAEIGRLWRDCGYLADPHTAVGTAAAMAVPPTDPAIPVVVAATAHPAKFPDAVHKATGISPPLPSRLADLYDRPERFTRLPAELDAIEGFVRAHARRNTA